MSDRSCRGRDELIFRPIGVVEQGLPQEKGGAVRSRFEVRGVIRVFEEFVEGLEGIEEYSHILVIYVMDRAGPPSLTVRHKHTGRKLGIFATRYPPRPNPIAVSVVELVRFDPPRLEVLWLDAWPGSPVLDIKPYDFYDIVRRPRVSADFASEWEAWKAGISSMGLADLLEKIGPC
jgi:tRNA-Thr(GGU) m(6)t(6)A37 methyltransferase TsaA